ncbi:uncharacterized protein LOC119085675 [Bradysia coprophila]|uniref:uncharacterized protein LOC119085159 n=1 Tax=Bradysia coprophila TaxID=38358 RepID=UPI00187DB18C|nr:uncharacterized protein LOC119085159 [Bradysia coprophila]XP_037052017.1 uncharacterized protein LOC119085674 [Bradysia coprophila]XP_037052018.1 uncharacterized protein LOC119085675 [Bradysia coprophila]
MAKNQMMEVENNSTAETFPLNYDCSYELFKHVGFEECINLAEAYHGLRPVAKWICERRFNKFALDFQKPVNRILSYAGRTATALILTLNKARYTPRDLIKIHRACKQLRCLTLNGFDMEKFQCNPFANFGNGKLEELTLNECSLANEISFFDGYRNLKSFNIFNCEDMNVFAIQRCFKINRLISFTCNDQFFQVPQMLTLLPTLERLSLRYNHSHMTLDMLSQLPSLRCLTLLCDHDNINDVLADLGKSNRLEELALVDVDINERTFPLIKSLQNLKLLSITTSTNSCSFPASNDWPTNLKKLKLEGFRIANGNIAPVVEQLINLEDMLLKNCELLRNDFWVSDFDWMADLVIDDLSGKRMHRTLNVAIYVDCDQSPKTIKSAESLRITNYVKNQNMFEISYPGMDGRFPQIQL